MSSWLRNRTVGLKTVSFSGANRRGARHLPSGESHHGSDALLPAGSQVTKLAGSAKIGHAAALSWDVVLVDWLASQLSGPTTYEFEEGFTRGAFVPLFKPAKSSEIPHQRSLRIARSVTSRVPVGYASGLRAELVLCGRIRG